MKLSTKVSVTITGVLALALVTGAIALLATREIAGLMRRMVSDNLASVKAAEELEIALLHQRGFVSAFILDGGNAAWLEELERRKPAFHEWLERARGTAHTDEERRILDQVSRVYQQYDRTRDRLLVLYHAGETAQATSVLLGEMNQAYERVYRLCEDLIAANERHIERSLAQAQAEVDRVTLTVGAAVGLTGALGAALLSIFFRGVILPLRRMANDARVFAADGESDREAGSVDDELRALGIYMRSLMSNVTETHSHLERSRMQLMTSEKLASLGKLAASVAHEIRNPLTSLKMRLYTVRSAEKGGADFDEDLRVISEEVSRLEEIVRNFLEFSRPPELKMARHEVLALVDKALELCNHWFVEKGVKVRKEESPGLPRVLVDPEQLKQVLLNLLRNAVEAVDEGGEVTVTAAPEVDRSGRAMVVVRIRDDGPGIPAEIRERIPEPFFSTKEEGTGLGLCIAGRIMSRHGGRVELESSGPPGATFAVWIPVARGGDG